MKGTSKMNNSNKKILESMRESKNLITITGSKAKIKGSLKATLKLVKCLMIGKNDVYKKRK